MFRNIVAVFYDYGAFPCSLQKKKKVLNLLIAFEVSTVLAAALGALLHLTCGEAQH